MQFGDHHVGVVKLEIAKERVRTALPQPAQQLDLVVARQRHYWSRPLDPALEHPVDHSPAVGPAVDVVAHENERVPVSRAVGELFKKLREKKRLTVDVANDECPQPVSFPSICFASFAFLPIRLKA